MRILFNQLEEFLDELAKDLSDPRADIHRRMVRLTRRYIIGALSPNIRHVFVDASYQVNGQVITLEVYCGDLWGMTKGDDEEVYKQSDKFFEMVQEFCTAHGVEIRGGGVVEKDTPK